MPKPTRLANLARTARQWLAPLYEVALIDRLTGQPHAVAGFRLAVLTCEPQLTREQMMRHRDTRRWDATVRPAKWKGNQ
ncbi:hypothetical protein GL279_12100 [Paracoccus limosus]|jgi:hypothetical protein|uniref:Uncharacterized protein n=1 Tax=Paracoccus limosus TaxID=913252 RepID=A0A844H6T7_9RHOB|nr:hypothetical protein [Paracoccus limosus]MTH35344.1 hypothetical protein [Paracoccus limosus]